MIKQKISDILRTVDKKKVNNSSYRISPEEYDVVADAYTKAMFYISVANYNEASSSGDKNIKDLAKNTIWDIVKSPKQNSYASSLVDAKTMICAAASKYSFIRSSIDGQFEELVDEMIKVKFLDMVDVLKKSEKHINRVFQDFDILDDNHFQEYLNKMKDSLKKS